MTDFQEKYQKKHVLFLTFPAFGHIIPTLELAKRTSAFHHVTFVVSNSKLKEMINRDLMSQEDDQRGLNVLGLDDAVVTDFDTISVPGFDRINRLLEQMQPAFNSLLKSMCIPGFNSQSVSTTIKRPVDVVIVERFVTSISLPICHELGLPCCIFNASSSSWMADSLDVNEDTLAGPDNGPAWLSTGKAILTQSRRRFLINLNYKLHLASAFISSAFLKCEQEGIERLAAHPKTKGIPVFCVGPIFPSEEKTNSKSNAAMVTKWLDQQKPRSVIYVSFGTLAALSPAQTDIMGKALLFMKKPFIYSIPEALQSSLPEEIRQKIKSQFDEKNSLFLVLPWAPQKAILKHSSTGVFVTHGGWNSTLEGISGGVPMVLWPMFGDQLANGSWQMEQGIGVSVPDVKMIGSRLVPLEEICEVVAEAEKCRGNVEFMARACEAALAENGSSHRDFMELMKFNFAVHSYIRQAGGTYF